MAVRIRLRRMGAKKAPFYRVVVADSRYPRDGRFIEQVGIYDPTKNPSIIEIDLEKVQKWTAAGAQPTETVKKLITLTKEGKVKVAKQAEKKAPVAINAEQAEEDKKDGEPSEKNDDQE